MTVLQLISSGGFYGAERMCVTLSAELQRMGVRVVVGAFRNSAKAIHLEVLTMAEQAGLQTEQIDCKGRLDQSAIKRVQALVEQNDIDVIHTHGVKSDLYALLAARSCDVRLVGTCHSWTTDSLKHRAISILDRLLLRGFDSVAIVTDSLRTRLRCVGVREERIRTIDNGIDTEPFGRQSAIESRKIERNALVVGTVARLASVKGIGYLLDAAALLIPEFPSIEFAIVGAGPELEVLKNHASSLGISANVRFTGSRNDLPEVYSQFDVFVLPSLSEGMPMALMEAMAAGCAVVASAVGSVPKMITDNQNGILVQPANADLLAARLRQLLACPETRAALGQSARETATMRFSAGAMARNYLSLYESAGAPLAAQGSSKGMA